MDGLIDRAINLHQAGRIDEAVDAYRQGLALDDQSLDGWWGLGCAQSSLGNHAGAVEAFGQAVALEPGYARARHNLAAALLELGEVDTALGHFRQVVAEQPNELSLEMIAVSIPNSPSAIDKAIAEARRQWAKSRSPKEVPWPVKRKARPAQDGRIRVGYVSSYFGDRNWMKPVWGLINQHDREQFQLCLFSDMPAASIRDGYEPHPDDRIVECANLSNSALAERIAAEGIDILVDLNGYSRPARLGVFEARPASVQVAWFNHYAPSGLDCFDYVVADDHVLPRGAEGAYSGEIVRVRGSYLTFEVNYPVPAVAPAPCLSGQGLVFGCLAPLYKITDEVIGAWARILRETPGSRLMLKCKALGSEGNQGYLRERFAGFGIPAGRLILEGPAEHYEFLKSYDSIDVALDTFPYNGGTTTMEALWQGVPVITFEGDRWASRIGASLLRSAGLEEFVARDVDGYIRLAVTLANHQDAHIRLANLRAGLRDRVQASPVCDTRGFARGMEGHFRVMLECTGQRG